MAKPAVIIERRVDEDRRPETSFGHNSLLRSLFFHVDDAVCCPTSLDSRITAPEEYMIAGRTMRIPASSPPNKFNLISLSAIIAEQPDIGPSHHKL